LEHNKLIKRSTRATDSHSYTARRYCSWYKSTTSAVGDMLLPHPQCMLLSSKSELCILCDRPNDESTSSESIWRDWRQEEQRIQPQTLEILTSLLADATHRATLSDTIFGVYRLQRLGTCLDCSLGRVTSHAPFACCLPGPRSVCMLDSVGYNY
jgi:hypothetical protein